MNVQICHKTLTAYVCLVLTFTRWNMELSSSCTSSERLWTSWKLSLWRRWTGHRRRGCAACRRGCVWVYKAERGANVKSDSGSKFLLALLAFTQEATEINVKYFPSKLVVTIKYQNVFQIWHNKQMRKVKLLSCKNSGAFNCQHFISTLTMTDVGFCS